MGAGILSLWYNMQLDYGPICFSLNTRYPKYVKSI